MERKKVVTHTSGKKHPGETNWAKVLRPKNSPLIDSENPELARVAGKKFIKPGKKS